MSLLAHLALRGLLVTILCLAGTAAWILHEARSGLRAEAAISAERVAEAMARQPGLGSAGAGPVAPPGWRAAPAILTILPGICVEIALAAEAPRRLCGGWDGMAAAPAWFRVLLASGAAPTAATRAIAYRGRPIGHVAAWPEAEAAAGRAWGQVRVAAGLALGMAGAMALLGGLAAARLLAPAGRIVRGLREIEAGDGASRMPRFGAREFDGIAAAFNAMAERLSEARAERAALTGRLFQVQEEERRALARDLHDEFGQCLTATGALADSIAADAAGDRPGLCADARAIGAIAARMMETLRGALARLEPPDLAELGLEGSLRGLVAGWRGQARPAPDFHIDVTGDLAGLPLSASASLYRIAQEFLTNAVRHGRPSRVFVRVLRADDGLRPVTLIVDDDGGGGPLPAILGRGLLGIRARVAALGGSLSITPTGSGIRACAVVPTLG
ncbi:MAG TPA: histidine kinase [Methylobacterium sp.]|jgi:signal transduction histidine kinase|nr:histidine kinase [Methylobacterium sp.]